MSSSNVEDSPQSDSKMDISDTTNSMESTGVSPIVELPRNNLINTNDTTNSHRHKVVASAYMCSVIHNDVSQNVECAQAPTEMQVECILYEKEQLQGRSNSHHSGVKSIGGAKVQTLDNRYVDNICLPRMVTLSEKHLSSLTVANNHPLMSPTGTDSDSENSCLVQVKVNHKFRNYPDVIPNSERGSVQKSAKAIELFDNELNASTVKCFNQKVEGSSLISVKNNMNGNKTLGTKRNKFAVLRSNSPDLLSSGSEADVSQYHAAVESNFQSVVLLPNVKNENDLNAHARLSAKRTGGGEVVVAGSEDVSSLDSISNHSFDDDEDIEHNLASLSPSSSLIDGLEQDDDDDDDDDDDCEGPENADDDDDGDCQEGTTPTNMKPTDALPQYSVEEERRDSRNWQKLTLPDGSTRDIDMKVIEPYKRVLSHGGYLKAGGHNAIVIFCACHLPDRSRADYHYVMDNLFLYVVKTLDQLVTEDYVLIYLHGGTSRRNVPPFPWLKKCYQLLDRRLRKSLKNMYLVHPTFWIKSIVWMARPFVSTKFWRKLIYVKSLTELGTHVAVEKAAIPDKVKQYDAKYN